MRCTFSGNTASLHEVHILWKYTFSGNTAIGAHSLETQHRAEAAEEEQFT
jgi:hypothetical protein